MSRCNCGRFNSA